MKKRISFMLLAVAAVLISCTGAKEEVIIPRVHVIEPQPVTGENRKNYTGITEVENEIGLAFKTPGELKKIHVHEGDYVSEGDLLAELDDKDYKLGVEAIQIQYDQLKTEVARIEKLYKQKSISENDYEKAQSGLKQLAVQLQVNKNKLNYTKLYAPASGYIQSVNFSEAEMVDAGTILFKLLNISAMEIYVDIPVVEYQQRSTFKEYYCKVPGIAEPQPLKLISITPKADGNQLYRAKFKFNNSNIKHLTAGMNVELTILSASENTSSTYTLPMSSIFKDGQQACVWQLNPDSTLTKQAVEVSEKLYEGKAHITSGLQGGEKIVRTGVNQLQQGEKVTPIENQTQTNVGDLL